MKALEVKDVHLTYEVVRPISIKQSLFKLSTSKKEQFEALKGISFCVEQGDIIGIIGKNGSGKSTLLKAIAGIFNPNSGEIDLFGNSISLMAIGVGFQPQLSGRENIYLSGLLLGFSMEQINARENAIIEFSELGKFIDMPVKTYSSGMYSKLAFSISANMETDIILIDEVLSVGDAKFKKKSLQKMKELINDCDRTVMMVSHSLDTIGKLCTKVLWIDQGKVRAFGETKEVLQQYADYVEKG